LIAPGIGTLEASEDISLLCVSAGVLSSRLTTSGALQPL
jgi:hypothetical protein